MNWNLEPLSKYMGVSENGGDPQNAILSGELTTNNRMLGH